MSPVLYLNWSLYQSVIQSDSEPWGTTSSTHRWRSLVLWHLSDSVPWSKPSSTHQRTKKVVSRHRWSSESGGTLTSTHRWRSPGSWYRGYSARTWWIWLLGTPPWWPDHHNRWCAGSRYWRGSSWWSPRWPTRTASSLIPLDGREGVPVPSLRGPPLSATRSARTLRRTDTKVNRELPDVSHWNKKFRLFQCCFTLNHGQNVTVLTYPGNNER